MPHHRRSTKPLVVIGAIAVVVGAALFTATYAADARRLVAGLGTVDPGFLLVGIVLSVLAIINRGLLNRAAHRAVGIDADAAEMTQTAAIGFAAQKLVRSAGAVGLAVFVREGRRRGRAPGEVAAACVLSAVASFLALGVLLTVAIALLAMSGRLDGWWIAAAAGFGLYATTVAVIGTVVARSRALALQLWITGQRLRHRIMRREVPDADAVDVSVPHHLFDAVSAARERRGDLRVLLLHGVASKVLGALMLAAAVAAVGLPVDSSGAIIVYATALAASMVTIVPGGVGTVEGSTAALLVASGAALAPATLAVVLFRCFDLLMPVAAGAVAAKGSLRAPDAVELGPSEVGDRHAETGGALPVAAAA